MNQLINTLGVGCILLFLSSGARAQTGIGRRDAERAAQREWNAEKQRLLPAAQKVWNEGVTRLMEFNMPIAYRVFGEKPAGGRSLFISLHGGGQAPVAVNDQQWENQRTLYNIREGLVIVPRAPTNNWNLWHESHIDDMLDSLIRYAIVMEDVNPDKVYILGYSAGGDGVFQLGPRMADRWAAASMMAGHPGDADMRNLRNLPFAIYIGGLDSAYHRNALAITYNRKLDSLQKLDPGGFVHDFHLYADKKHWMDKKDTVAIEWMASFSRNPLPKKVFWVQDNRLQHRFYWLSAPLGTLSAGDSALVSIKGNTITIEQNNFKEIEINLNDQMVDLDKPVRVTANGKVIFSKKVHRTLNVIKKTMRQYQDPRLVFSVKLLLVNNQIKQVY